MRVEIRGKNIEVSTDLRTYIEKKLKSLNKYGQIAGTQTLALVEVKTYTSTRARVALTLDVPGLGSKLRSDASAISLKVAINHSVKKIEDQIRRIKTKAKNQ